MPFRELLEEFPLYRKLPNCPWQHLNQVEKPTIHMFCPVCRSEQAFIMANEYYEGYEYANYPLDGVSVRAVYLCVSCQDFKRYFLIKFGVLRHLGEMGRSRGGSQYDKRLCAMNAQNFHHVSRLCSHQATRCASLGWPLSGRMCSCS
jgi:hypothetical protein